MMTAETMMAEARTAQTAGDLLRSAQILEALLRQWPDHPKALNMLGTILLNRGSVQRACEVLERATKADPAVAPIWLNLARAQRQLEEFAGERLSLAAALDCNPYLLIAHVRKAELHVRLGEEADAVAAWQSVLTLCRADPQPSDAVLRLVEQAEAYVEPRTARMTAELQLGLKSARADLAQAATRRFDVAVGHAMGTRPIYESKSSGLHFPFLPAEEFFDRDLFPWLADLEAAKDDIRSELANALACNGQAFAPYVEQAKGAAPNIWSELSRSTRWSAYYLWRYGVRNDSACERCPVTAKVLEALPRADHPGRAPTAFFSLLAPGVRIPPHTGVSNTRAIVHLPLVVPADCGFRVGGETRQWHVGDAFVFDDTIEHEAWNDSDETRAVLIFDVWNPYLTPAERDLVRAFYGTADSSGLIPRLAASF